MSRQTKANCFCHPVFVLAGMDDCKAEIFKLISQTEPLFSGAYAVRKQKIPCPAKSSCKRTLYETESHRSWVGPKSKGYRFPAQIHPSEAVAMEKEQRQEIPPTWRRRRNSNCTADNSFNEYHLYKGLPGPPVSAQLIPPNTRQARKQPL